MLIARVILTGFMGAGKSTVGPLLAQRLGWTFTEIDRRIEAERSLSIAAIFEQEGESRFRELEAIAVAQAIEADNAVIALGGGALESAATRERLRRSSGSHIVLLEVPLAVALERCGGSGPESALRPVLRNRALLEARYNARLPFYREAHQTIDTAQTAPDETVEAIAAAIGR